MHCQWPPARERPRPQPKRVPDKEGEGVLLLGDVVGRRGPRGHDGDVGRRAEAGVVSGQTNDGPVWGLKDEEVLLRITVRPCTEAEGGAPARPWGTLKRGVPCSSVKGGGGGRASFEQVGGEGGRGFWTQNLVYQKWPDQIFPIVNFVFSRDGHFGLGRGGGGFGGRGPPPPLWFLIILKKPWGGGGGLPCPMPSERGQYEPPTHSVPNPRPSCAECSVCAPPLHSTTAPVHPVASLPHSATRLLHCVPSRTHSATFPGKPEKQWSGSACRTTCVSRVET